MLLLSPQLLLFPWARNFIATPSATPIAIFYSLHEELLIIRPIINGNLRTEHSFIIDNIPVGIRTVTVSMHAYALFAKVRDHCDKISGKKMPNFAGFDIN